MADWPLVGRAAELAGAEAHLAAGRGVLFAGPPGVGKTALATELAGCRGPDGAVWLRPVAELRGVPFGSVALLMAPMVDPSLSTAANALSSLVADRLLVVDDAHLLDEASAGLLHQLVSIVGIAPILTLPSGETPPDAVTRLWKDGLVARLDVEPLDLPAVGQLLDAAVGGPVDPALVDDVWRRTMGSPLFVRELVGAATDDGTIAPDRSGRWRAQRPLQSSPRLADLVRARLAHLPDDVQAAFELVAVADAVPLDVLERACAPGAIAALEARRLVRVDGVDRPVLRAAHPFVAHTAAELVPVAARREWWRRLAGLLDEDARTPLDRARVLRWRLDGGAAVDEDPAALQDGARAALEVGDVELAARACDRLVAAAPTFEHSLLRARVLLRAERHADAVTALDAAEPLAVTDDDVVALAQSRAQVLGYGQGLGAEAGAALADAKARAGDRLPHVEGALLLYLGRPAEALAIVEGAAGLWPGDAGIYGGVVEACALLLAGRLDDAMAVCRATDELIDRELAGRTDPLGDRRMVELLGLVARGERGDLAGATRAAAESWTRWADGGGGGAAPGSGSATGAVATPAGATVPTAPWAHWLAWAAGRLALHRGQAGEAAAWFRRSEAAVGGRLPVLLADWVPGGLAYAELLSGGGSEGSGPGLAAGPEAAAGAGLGDDGPDRAQAWLLATAGRTAEAVAVLGTAADRLEAAAHLLFEASLRHDQVRLGSATPAAVDRLVALTSLVDGDLMAARAAHARALAGADHDALAGAAEAFAALGAHLFAAEAAGQGAALAARRGERRAGAIEALAAECRSRCDAGGAPSLGEPPAPEGLTRREHEIASLAAAGRASKEIATELGISRRTVDNTLQRVFMKLGVANRTDLAGRL